MRVSAVVAQTRVTWDVQRNLAAISAALAGTRPGELVVLPEAAVSGYDDDLSGLGGLDPETVRAGIDRVAEQAQIRGIHIFCGSLLPEDDGWANAALYFAPDGSRQVYRKINLATRERGRLVAGGELPVIKVHVEDQPLLAGIQLCREISYPEQWRYLAAAGAQVFVYLTNAANPAWPAGVWRSHLISHAAASQRYVLAANAADPRQHCPSAIISPKGEVIGELAPAQAGLLRAVLDTDDCDGRLIGQRREDLLPTVYRGT